ncbi:hypothetical protein LINGRAHAP2_LOCUS17576 [Linum grandiflorum]
MENQSSSESLIGGEMKGVGGPLLNIGDLLSDLAEKDEAQQQQPSSSSSPTDFPPSMDLLKLFQENYEELNEALEGSDPNWTALTLKLCTCLETANKLVRFANSNAGSLSEKVAELEKLVKRGDSAVAAAKSIPLSLGLKTRLQSSSPPSQETQLI